MKLVITEPKDFSKTALSDLSQNFEIIQLKNIENLDAHIKSVDILFIRLGIVFNREVLEQAKDLKIICSPTTGLDHIDLDYCQEHNIKVISLKGERDFLDSIPSTAEHTWTLLLAINRGLYQANENINSKVWNRNAFKSYNLKGKTLGILGLGRVGKQIVKYAKAFEMDVVGYDINEDIVLNDVKNLSSAQDLFIKSDFISIHIPLNHGNFEYINHDLISLMKPKACIINTSRGKIWDEKAITNSLLNGRIRGVATDVIYNELDENWHKSPILNVDTKKYNCIITPHIAGATFDSMQMTEEYIAKKMISHVN